MSAPPANPLLPPAVQALYPFAAHYLDLDGVRMHYLDEGSGPTVVLLHGNPTWSFYYRELVLALRGEYRVIVPDHIGCGLSDKPQDYPYRLATHVANLERLLTHLNVGPLTLGVHDWGGPIGLGYAARHREALERLVVFNTTCHLTRDYPWRILVCKLPLLGALGVRGLNGFVLAAQRLAVCQRAPLAPSVRAGYLLPYDTYAHRVAVHRFVQDIPLGPGHPTWATGQEILANLDWLRHKPTLICWGARDFCFTDRFLAQWRQRLPQARVHVFPAAGHYVVEDAAPEIIPLLREFLHEPDVPTVVG